MTLKLVFINHIFNPMSHSSIISAVKPICLCPLCHKQAKLLINMKNMSIFRDPVCLYGVCKTGRSEMSAPNESLTFVHSFVGHAIDVAGAALRNQPLHHCVHAGLPVGTPHAPTDGEKPVFNTNACSLNTTKVKTDVCRSSCSPGLTLDLSEVTHTHSTTYTSVKVPADLQVGMVRVRSRNNKNNK